MVTHMWRTKYCLMVHSLSCTELGAYTCMPSHQQGTEQQGIGQKLQLPQQPSLRSATLDCMCSQLAGMCARSVIIYRLGGGVAEALVHTVNVLQRLRRQLDAERTDVLLYPSHTCIAAP